MSMLTYTVTGLLTGLMLQYAASRLAVYLLQCRGKQCTQTKTETLLLSAFAILTSAAVYALSESAAETVYLLMLLVIGETIAITDYHARIIPNEMSLAIIMLSAVFGIPSLLGAEGFPEFNPLRSLLGLAGCFIIFLLPSVFSKKVGAGDVKLAAAMGFCLGLWNSLISIALMGVLILVYMLLQTKVPAVSLLKTMVPMGPFLSCSMVLVLLLMKFPLFYELTAAMPF